MNKPTASLFLAGIVSTVTAFGQTIPFSSGRIACSSDGNEHDKDDWGATAATLMIIASQNAQNKLAVYTHSDHIWGSSSVGDKAMQLSAEECGKLFGFEASNIISAVSDPTAAYHRMRDAILASSASDPLTIIGAGPMHVIGTGLQLAREIDPEPLQYVLVISHSKWNNRHADNPYKWEKTQHTGWTWDEMVRHFTSDGVTFTKIADQNSGTSTTKGFSTRQAANGKSYWPTWYFLRDYSNQSPEINAAIQFVYSRMEASTAADISDCGMAYYLFTGNEKGGPADLKAMLDNGFTAAEQITTD
ncbi:hypothetical protein [Pontiella agarivorans]|uniref:Uncharacterized protein n=1 Tax=Pontiella agarivorans TaxID=3038953 RepID=A0ABU5MY77_9BACT|nr:hypothetical protein [Pontiella agarivorans]MDZ8119152.1 hypothetical protein [Pontiella agarivorans]